MSNTDEVHCPECEDPECMGCVEIRSEDLSGIKLKKLSDQTKFSNELDVWDSWDDDGGSIPPE